MHLDADRARLVERWNAAAADLGIAIESPFECALESGHHLHVPVLVRDFGATRGMLVDSSGLAEFGRELVKAGFGYSEMSPPRADEAYSRTELVDVLREWGWTGPDAAQPWWLEPGRVRVRDPRPITAGDRELLAIEAVIDADAEPDQVFGRLHLWIRGSRLGHEHGFSMLNGCRNWLVPLAEDEVDRCIPEWLDLDPASILASARRAVYVDGAPESLLSAWERCEFADIFLDALEGYEILLLETRDGRDRIVWKRPDSAQAHEVVLPRQTVRQVAWEFVERFDAAR